MHISRHVGEVWTVRSQVTRTGKRTIRADFIASAPADISVIDLDHIVARKLSFIQLAL